MQNYFANETEAAHRWREWERSIAAAALIAQAHPQTGRTHWTRLPSQLLPWLRSLLAPRLPIACSQCIAAMECATVLPGSHATGT